MQVLSLGGRQFEPQDPHRISVYLCGPTLYRVPHLGNLRSAVSFDVLHRVLARLYPNVAMVRNYTDIDDKIIEAAQGGPLTAVTQDASVAYEADLDILNVLAPTSAPRVTESIPEIISFIEGLLACGAAYFRDEHVLFDRAKRPEFFLNVDLVTRASEDVAYKNDPRDFVLWKPSRDDQPGWPSPWGRGRPGWHIECSAMILASLGETIDIHCGGVDLKFPHHENECAQSTALTGKPLARYWLHNGMLDFGGKMSKSRGNIVLLETLMQRFSPMAVRYFLLTAHYPQPLAYAADRMESAERSIRPLRRALQVTEGVEPSNYLGPLLDDLNTPRALTELHRMTNDIVREQATQTTMADFNSLMGALGLIGDWYDPTAALDERVRELQERRAQARDRRDFTEADRLRDMILAMGIEVNDSPLIKKA